MASFSREDIAEMDIKDLNRLIKANKMTNEDSKFVKDMRRKMKMRAYGVKNRQRKKDEYQALEKTRQYLTKELGELLQEVDNLRKERNTLYRDRYIDDDDEEYIDIC